MTEMTPIPPAEAATLARQAGVLTRGQAVELFGEGYVRWAVHDGRWQRPTARTLVTHNADLTRIQQVWVALLTSPPGSCLGGLTALEIDGFAGIADGRIHVVIPQGQRRPASAGLSVHWSSRLDERDVHPLRVPRRTKPARSLLDAAAWTTSDSRARIVLLSGVQQRLVTPSHMREALERRGPCPRRRLIVETISDAEGGIQSIPEREFDLIVRRRGLPAPTRQRICRRADGRYYLDVDWDGYGVGAEIEGRHHFEVLRWDADLDRHNDITASGRRLLHFTSFSVRHRAERVGTLLSTALGV